MVEQRPGYKPSSRYEPHPYIIYVRRANSYGKCPTGEFTTNNFGFTGKRNVELQKSVGIKRVICIGGSTTEMVFETPDNTYPDWLGKELGDSYEVLNAGVSGYTTAEMLINFELRLLDFNPDIIVIYAGFNDIKGAGMYSQFKSDYTHARATLGYTPVEGDKGLLYNIIPPGAKLRTNRVPDKAIATYKRNINSMIGIAKHNGILPIVVEFNLNPNNNYPANMVDGIMRNIAATKGIVPNYVKVWDIVESDFIDGCHFNTSGMQKMARAISKEILSL